VFKKGYSADPSSIDAAQNSGGSCTEVSPLAVDSKVGWPGYTFTGGEDKPKDLTFSTDGNKMFVVGTTNDMVYEYRLGGSITNSSGTFSFPGPYCLGTAHKMAAFGVHSQSNVPEGIAFSNDGRKMFIVGSGTDKVHEYNLSENFLVNGTGKGYGFSSTATFVDSFSVGQSETSPRGIAFSNDGLKMFIVGNSLKKILEYNLSENFDISTASFVDGFTLDTTGNTPAAQGMAFSNDGLKMFVVDSDADDVQEYNLSENFDVSTASYVDAFSVTSQDGNAMGVAFDYSGNYMFIVGFANDKVHVYKLSEPFDVSTAVVQTG